MISFDRDLYREEIYCISQVNLNENDVKLFFQMFPFDRIKNARKPNITYLCVRVRGQEMLGCLMFARRSKGKTGRKRVKNILFFIRKSFGKYKARI